MSYAWIIVAGICCNANGDPQVVKADPSLVNMPPLTQQVCFETALELNKTFLAMQARTFVHCEPKPDDDSGQ